MWQRKRMCKKVPRVFWQRATAMHAAKVATLNKTATSKWKATKYT